MGPRLPRRAVLPLVVAAAIPGARAQPALPSLKAAAAAAGLLIGTDSDVPIASGIPGYADLIRRQFDLLAPLLSWSYVAGRADEREPVREDPNIAFARDAHMKLTGGHLLWYMRTPSWFAGLDPAAARQAVQRHIAVLAGRYAGQVYSWNVDNEAIETRRGDPNGMRASVLSDRLGPDYMAAAFRMARAADPRALLLYNDAQLEMATSYQAGRRDAMLRLLDRLARADAPIDGVGLQSHLVLDDTAFDQTVWSRFLDEIAARKLKIVITELDVFDRRGGPDIAARDADVAARYTAFLDATLAQAAVKAVVLWGVSDRYTWLVGTNQPNLGRPDGLPTRPLPFDADLRPKPAFSAILEALRRAPHRAP